MLGYLANTLIFILVGVLIAQQAFFGIEGLGWMYLVVVYLTLTVIRWVWCRMLTHPSTLPILSHKLNYMGCMPIFTTLSFPFLD